MGGILNEKESSGPTIIATSSWFVKTLLKKNRRQNFEFWKEGMEKS